MGVTERGCVPDPRPFEFVAGDVALDYCNTLGSEARDRLFEYGRLVEWAEARGMCSHAEARKLRQLAGERPAKAQAAYRTAVTLRDALVRIFGEFAEGRRPAPADLNVLNARLSRALASLRLSECEVGCEWSWASDEDDLERLLNPVARDASELLTHPDRLARVRLCAADDCRWLFLDTSKNRTRRWCDMASCGNREKARRFYRAKKDA